ncbi:MAG TPA: hypothetical protein VIL70_08410 [Chthoniobacterales bacterium]|jgi:hypothetical protein
MRKIEHNQLLWRDQFPELDDDELKLLATHFYRVEAEPPFMLFCIPNRPHDDELEMWEELARLNICDKAQRAYNEKRSYLGEVEMKVLVALIDRKLSHAIAYTYIEVDYDHVLAAIYDKPWATISFEGTRNEAGA